MNECKRQSNWKTFKDDEEAGAEAAVASFNKCLLSRRRELHFQGNGKFFLKRFHWSPHCAAVHQSAAYMVQDTTTNSTFHNYFISVLLFFLRTFFTVSGDGMCVNIWTSRYWKTYPLLSYTWKDERMKKVCKLAHPYSDSQIQTWTYIRARSILWCIWIGKLWKKNVYNGNESTIAIYWRWRQFPHSCTQPASHWRCWASRKINERVLNGDCACLHTKGFRFEFLLHVLLLVKCQNAFQRMVGCMCVHIRVPTTTTTGM